MGRIILQKNNKNAGKRAVGLGNILAGVVALTIIGTSLMVSGCGFPRSASAAATDTPAAAQTASPTMTPTLEPTETPTPIPSSTPKTVPELTEEQVQKQMELLNVVTPNEKIDLDRITFVCYYRTDEKGNKTYTVEFTKIQTRISNGNTIMIRLSDDTPLFEFNCEYLDYAPTQSTIVPRCESLKDVKVCAISALCSLEYVCEEYGIPYNKNASSLSKKFNSMSYGIIPIEGEYTYKELLELYIRYLSKENRAVASDFVGPIEYVAPTAFIGGNGSVKYLMGERDLDTEMENKTKRL